MVKNRIKDIREVKASDLLPNPLNWRKHPAFQRNTMKAVFDEVGNIDILKVVETPDGLMLIDGHLRADVLQDEPVQVAVLDLTEDEQRLVLATYDPLAQMAERGMDAYLALAASVRTENPDINKTLEAVANDNYVSLMPLVDMTGDHVNLEDGILWKPEEDTTDGSTAVEFASYDLGSVWMRGGDAESRVHEFMLPLPRNPAKAKKGALTANYSRSPAREMEWIVRTYMRPGDYFLEVCAGWWTFSTTAAVWGFSGEGVDIWDTSLKFGKQQLAKCPPGSGHVKIVEGNATALPYPDEHFDFVYCNPPFWQLEKYSESPDDLANEQTMGGWLERSGDMMTEMLRVAKPGR